MNFLTMQNGKVVDSGSVTFPDLTKEEDCIIIPLEDTTLEDLEELREQKRKREQKFNRAKVKRETQRYVDEELYGEDYEI